MRPFKLAVIVLGTLALFFVGFLVVGVLLPSGWEAERSVRIPVPPEALFPLLSGGAGWREWTPSPETGVEAFGPEEGAGSGYRWDDPGYGAGEFQILSVLPGREVRYEVAVEGGSIGILGHIQVEGVEGESLVTWREEGDFGWNPLLGYLAGRMNELQGAQLEASLAELARVAEALSATTVRD